MTNARKRYISLPLIAFCALLILSGCDTPGGFDDPQEGYGFITVSIDDEFARTIYPLVEFARYDYFFAKVINGKTRDFEKQTPVDGIFTLELGDWQVRVDVYATEDDPYPAATGTSVIFTVSREGIRQVKIQLTGNEESGYGSFSYYITYPAGTTIDTFELKPYPTPGTTIDLTPASVSNSVFSGIRADVPAGCYSITIFLSNGESKAGASDAVYILEKLESAYGTAAKPIVFTERNFIKPTGTPAAADFTFGNLAQVAGNGVQPVTVTPREGKSTGAITVYYNGSQTLPTDAGTYTVTFDVTASPNWWAEYNLSAGTLVLVDPSNVIDVNDASEWGYLSTGTPGNYIVNIKAHFTVTNPASNTFFGGGAGYVFINGNDKEISLSGIGSLIRIAAGQAVTMNDLTLKGYGSNNTALVFIDGGTFIMNSGMIMDNNNGNGRGGGVMVASGDTFIMNGGAISNNKSTNGGGGVFVEAGTIIMNGGTISDNTTEMGGGVFMESGTITMNGGTISNNTGNDEGGGVYIYTGCTFTMNGGTIYDNTVGNHGGGVSVYGTFNMESGTISGNTAGESGGGVIVCVYGTFTMEGGAISGNKAWYGGGVSVMSSSTFNMNGGTISGNTVRDASGGGVGGGVYLEGGISNKFQITKGTVYGAGEGALSNNAPRGGSALFNWDGNCTVQYYRTGSSSWEDILPHGPGSTNLFTDNTIRVVGGVLK